MAITINDARELIKQFHIEYLGLQDYQDMDLDEVIETSEIVISPNYVPDCPGACGDVIFMINGQCNFYSSYLHHAGKISYNAQAEEVVDFYSNVEDN